MSIKHDFQHSIRQLLKQNRQGSFATHHERLRIVKLFADGLFELGFKPRHIRSLKQKHITAVVAHWQKKELSVGSVKNRPAVMRRVAYFI